LNWHSGASATRYEATTIYGEAATAISEKRTSLSLATELLENVGAQVAYAPNLVALNNAVTAAQRVSDAFEPPTRIGLSSAAQHLENAQQFLGDALTHHSALDAAIELVYESHHQYLIQRFATEQLESVTQSFNRAKSGQTLLQTALNRADTVLTTSIGRVDNAEVRTRLADEITSASEIRNLTISEALNLTRVPVTRVIDGDTIVVDYHGVSESVRLIGVDTPESGQPGFDAATDFTRNQIESSGGYVYLQQSGNDRDPHGRLRRCVFLDGGATLLNVMLISSGHGVPLEAFGTCDVDAITGAIWDFGSTNGRAASALASANTAVTRDIAARDARIAEEERIAAERRAEQERLAAERRAEQQRLAEQRAAEQRAAERRAAEQSNSNQSGGGGHGITRFRNCTHVWEVLGRSIRRGEPGFHSALDRDNDGVGCEFQPGTFRR